MFTKTLLAAGFAALLSAGAIAQTATTTAPAAAPITAPAAGMTPPAARTAAPAATRPAAIPAGTKVNLNTATASELDALPSVGKARLKVIMDERAKGSFKDWADFDKRTQHTSVNGGVKAKIKDLVTF